MVHIELDNFGAMVVDFFTAMMIGDQVFSLNPLTNLFNPTARDRIAKGKKETERITNYLIAIIKEHEATFDADNLRDFMDCCLKQGEHKKVGCRVLSNAYELNSFNYRYDHIM